MRPTKLFPIALLMLVSACSKSDKAKNDLAGNSWRLTTIYGQPMSKNKPGTPRQDDFASDFLTLRFSNADSFVATGAGRIIDKGTYQQKGVYLFTAPIAVSGIWLDDCSLVVDGGGQTLTLSKRVYTTADSNDYTDLREVFVKVQ
jgi:hypothetical protein